MILRQHLERALSNPVCPAPLKRDFFAQHPDIWWQHFCVRHDRICNTPYSLDAHLVQHLRELVPELCSPLSEHKKLHHRINQSIAITAFALHKSAGPVLPIHALYAICSNLSVSTYDTSIQKQIIRPWFDVLDLVKACPHYNGNVSWPAETFVPFVHGIIEKYRHQANPALTALAVGAVDQIGKGYPPQTVFEIEINQLLGKAGFASIGSRPAALHH